MNISLPIRQHHALRPYNTFGIAVEALWYLSVTQAQQLPGVWKDPVLKPLPKMVLGGGSNVLLMQDYAGLVLHMHNKGIRIVREDAQAVCVEAAAGEIWHELVAWTLEKGLGGLENLSAIPGTVGAAPVQNIGAYGAECRDFFESLQAFDFESGTFRVFDREACAFAYRDSFFKSAPLGQWVITAVTFALPKAWQPNLSYAELAQGCQKAGMRNPTPQEISRMVMSLREGKLPDPAVQGNAGSFFKNPTVEAAQFKRLKERFSHMPAYPQSDGRYRIAAGWMIDQCGWKGKEMGEAAVYATQALVLVNKGRATGQDVMQLAQAIRADVFERFGLELEMEPVCL